MVTSQKAVPRWLNLMNRPTPPAPPPPGDNPIEAALADHQTLRDNYVNVCGQLTEAHDLLRELAHQNEALEKTIVEDRTYYQGEVDRLQRESDELKIFRTQIRTRLSTIVEVILATDRAAQQIATEPAEQEIVEYTTEKPPLVRRAVPRFAETEVEAAEVRRVVAGINLDFDSIVPPINAYGGESS